MDNARLRSNFKHYYWDIAWWGLYAGTILPFLSVYAVRVGATTAQVGLLTALPAAVSLLLSLPVGRWVRHFSPKRATVVSVIAQRAFLVFLPILPWLLPPHLQIAGILLITAAMAVPGTVTAISFNQLLMDAVPPEYRGVLVGNRIAIFSILTFLVTLLSGVVLNSLAGTSGYQVIFAVGFIGAIMTGVHLSRINPLPAAENTSSQAAVVQPTRMLPVMDDVGRKFIKVLALTFLLNTVNSILVPILPPFAVNMLRLNDQWISLGAAANTFFVFLVSLRVARLTKRVGNRRATALGTLLLVGAALLMALARDAGLYLAAMLVTGIASGVLTTSQFNYVLEHVPAASRTAWFAVLSLAGNAAVLIGSLGGPALAGLISFPVIIAVVGLLRLLVGLALLKWG